MHFVTRRASQSVLRAAVIAAPVIALSAAATRARAADLTWAGADPAPGGAGTWVQDGSTLSWIDPTSVLVPWAPDNVAVFPAAAGAVTVSGTVSGVQAMRYTDPGYTVTGARSRSRPRRPSRSTRSRRRPPAPS